MPKTTSESLLSALSEHCDRYMCTDATDKASIVEPFYRRYSDLLSLILSNDETTRKIASEMTGKINVAHKELLDGLLSYIRAKSENPKTKDPELFKIWMKNLELLISNLKITAASRYGVFTPATATSAAAAAAAAATDHPSDTNIKAGNHRKKPQG